MKNNKKIKFNINLKDVENITLALKAFLSKKDFYLLNKTLLKKCRAYCYLFYYGNDYLIKNNFNFRLFNNEDFANNLYNVFKNHYDSYGKKKELYFVYYAEVNKNIKELISLTIETFLKDFYMFKYGIKKNDTGSLVRLIFEIESILKGDKFNVTNFETYEYLTNNYYNLEYNPFYIVDFQKLSQNDSKEIYKNGFANYINNFQDNDYSNDIKNKLYNCKNISEVNNVLNSKRKDIATYHYFNIIANPILMKVKPATHSLYTI